MALFKSLPEKDYKNMIVFFTGTEARSQIVNFQHGWEIKLSDGCLGDRPTKVIVLRDILTMLNEPIPAANDPDFDNFWLYTSRALASIASGSVYVIVPSDTAKWGTFYKAVEKDILIASPRVVGLYELAFDGPNKGKVTVIKGTKEFDEVAFLTAQEYEAKLGPAAKVNLEAAMGVETPDIKKRKEAMLAKLKARNDKTGSGSNTGGK